MHQTEILLKDKSSTTTNKKSKTNTDSVFNTKYRATHRKKHKTKTKTKLPSTTKGSSSAPKHQANTKKYTQNHVYIQRTYQNKKKPISLCFPTFSHHPKTKHQANTRYIYSKSRRLWFFFFGLNIFWILELCF